MLFHNQRGLYYIHWSYLSGPEECMWFWNPTYSDLQLNRISNAELTFRNWVIVSMSFRQCWDKRVDFINKISIAWVKTVVGVKQTVKRYTASIQSGDTSYLWRSQVCSSETCNLQNKKSFNYAVSQDPHSLPNRDVNNPRLEIIPPLKGAIGRKGNLPLSCGFVIVIPFQPFISYMYLL